MYYLCQINTSRQEQAAFNGIIPHLQRIIRANHPLKQFAFFIIFLIGKSKSLRVRLELKKYGGVEFYIEILKDPYWRTSSLDVLAKWLQDDRQRVEFILNANINKLFNVFRTTKDSQNFEKILPHFYRIIQTSIRVNRAMARSSVFINEIKNRLERQNTANKIRIDLLKILIVLYESHVSPIQFIRDYNFLPLLTKLSEDKTSVIVAQLAQKLIKKNQVNLQQQLQQQGGSGTANSSTSPMSIPTTNSLSSTTVTGGSILSSSLPFSTSPLTQAR
jgi:hypothetical protein